MEGTEEGHSCLYLDYFSQSYDFLDWPFLLFPKSHSLHLIQLFLNAQQVSPNLSSLRQVKYTLAINLERFNKSHLIENSTPLLTSHYSSLLQIPQFEQDIKNWLKTPILNLKGNTRTAIFKPSKVSSNHKQS